MHYHFRNHGLGIVQESHVRISISRTSGSPSLLAQASLMLWHDFPKVDTHASLMKVLAVNLRRYRWSIHTHIFGIVSTHPVSVP